MSQLETGYQALKGLIENVIKVALPVKAYAYKLLWVSLITNSVLAALTVYWVNSLSGWLVILLVLCYLPSFITGFVFTRLKNLEAVPEQLDALKELSVDFGADLTEELKGLANSGDGIKGKISGLRKTAPVLFKVKDLLAETAQGDLILTVMAVVNPLFGLISGLMLLPVAAWGLVSLIALFIWF